MQKIIFSLMLSAFTFSFIFAQPKTADEKVEASACDCLSKQEVKKSIASEFMPMIQKCLQQSLIENALELQKQGLDLTNQTQLTAYGEKLGAKLAISCSKFKELTRSFMEQSSTTVKTQTSTGTFVRVEKEGLAKLVFKEIGGKEVFFIWFNNFTNSEKFMTKSVTSAVGKSFTITWTEIEMYVPKAEGYYTVKQILSVE